VALAFALPSLWRYDDRTDPNAVRERTVRAARASSEAEGAEGAEEAEEG
jgi:hypothetical protein